MGCNGLLHVGPEADLIEYTVYHAVQLFSALFFQSRRSSTEIANKLLYLRIFPFYLYFDWVVFLQNRKALIFSEECIVEQSL